MPTPRNLYAMSTVLASGVILGLAISAGYAAESQETVPAEIVRTGLRLQMLLAFFVAGAIAYFMAGEDKPATPRRIKSPEEIARIKAQFYEGRQVEVKRGE